MNKYDIEWFVNDDGAQVRRVILHMPVAVEMADVKPEKFSVYVERTDDKGEVFTVPESWFSRKMVQTKGYRSILSAYSSDAEGNPVLKGDYVTLELDMADAQSRALVGSLHGSEFVNCNYRITQTAPIGTCVGQVFDQQNEIYCPQANGWSHDVSHYEELPLQYAYFNPEKGVNRPVIIWLHGAGEGGQDPRVAYMGNNVVSLSSDKIQAYFDSAWVLVPQSPTMWMDDGSHEYGRTGRSMYVKALKALIDEFVAIHPVDKNRIYIGGCSNGGFMTLRMMIDYPDFFAAGYPMCEALYDETISDEDITNIKDLPIWFLHAMTDAVVSPKETSVPTYERLMAAGATNVHFTYINDMPPFEMINHGVWVPGLKDEFNEDFDGRPVMVDGKPVTRFQWLAAQKRG